MASKVWTESGVSKRGVLLCGLRLAQAVGPDAGRASELASEYIAGLTILRPDLIEAERKKREKETGK